MDPMQWLQKAQQMRSAYLRNPGASRQAGDTFNQQVRAYLGEQELQDSQFPGRAPGGSGPTGLAPNDAFGYRQMLEGQQARQGLTSFLQGGSPQPNVRSRPDLPSTRSLDAATGMNNAGSFGMASGVSGGMLGALDQAVSGKLPGAGEAKKNLYASRYGRL